MQKIFLHTVFLASCVCHIGAHAQTTTLAGTIYSQNTKAPLSFAHIFIKPSDQSLIGTISDARGQFLLKMPFESLHDTLHITYLGHEQLTILIDTLETTTALRVYLPESETYLQSVVIRDLSAKQLIEKCVANASKNYFNVGYNNHYFYWQTIEEDGHYRNLAEGYLNVWENFHNQKIQRHTLQDSIVYANPLINYHYLEKVENAMHFDLIRSGSSFMNKENFGEWEFEYDNQAILPENYVTVRAVRLDRTVDLKILINDHDYAFEKIDYSYKWSDNVTYPLNDTLVYRFRAVDGVVVYKQEFGKYNLRYIYTDFSYDVHKKYHSKPLLTRRIRSEISLYAFRLSSKLPKAKPHRHADDDIIVINHGAYCEAAEALELPSERCDRLK